MNKNEEKTLPFRGLSWASSVCVGKTVRGEKARPLGKACGYGRFQDKNWGLIYNEITTIAAISRGVITQKKLKGKPSGKRLAFFYFVEPSTSQGHLTTEIFSCKICIKTPHIFFTQWKQ